MSATTVVLGAAIVPALAMLAWGARMGAARAAAWAALGIVGQAATLALWRAGPAVGFQHLVSPGEAATSRLPALVAVVVLGAAVVIGIARRRSEVSGWVRGRSAPVAVGMAVVAGSLLSVAPSANTGAWVLELLLGSLLQLVALSCIGLSVASLPDELASSLGQRLESWFSRDGKGPDRSLWAIAGLVTLVAAVLAVFSYQRHPHVPDEVAYLIHAKYFAQGMVWMPAPPAPGAFETFCLDLVGNRWFSVFPPGWPLLLAVGVMAGVPWLVNPLLGGLCVILAFLLVEELGDRRTARCAALLLAVSPWHLMLSMSFMSHVSTLALALGAGLGAARAWRTGSLVPAMLSGLALGVVGMSRPLEGVALGAVIGVPILVRAWQRWQPAPTIGLGIGTLLTGGLGLAYNRLLTGSALLFPAEPYFDRVYGAGRYGIGFGPEKGLGWTGLDPYPGHGAIDVVLNGVLNGFLLNIEMFGWWAGSLAIVALGLFTARGGFDRLMAALLLTVVGAHSVYWFSGGPDFGPRYWYLIIVPCAVLAIRGLDALSRKPDGAGAPSPRVLLAAALFTVGALVTFVPWRAADKYYHYRNMRDDVRSLSRDSRFAGSLVLVQGARHPDWASAAAWNNIDLTSPDPVFAWDRDATTRHELLAAFPDRPVWVIAGPTVTHDGYRVMAGPVAPKDRGGLPPPSTESATP